MNQSHQMILRSRPLGRIDESCFVLRQLELPPPQADDVLVDNLWMSIDPYMYIRALGGSMAGFGYPLNEPPDALSVGRVRSSRSSLYQEGDLVTSYHGWRDCFVASANEINHVPTGFDLPPEVYLTVLGNPAFTAWVGMTQFVDMRPRQTIFISGASGGVGTVACQLALRAGLKVIASAGTDDKCAWLKDLGDVETINYREALDLDEALRTAAPDGLDLYFDVVGGRQLEAAIRILKPRAHVIHCGAISTFIADNDPASALTDIKFMSIRSTTMHAYNVSHFMHLHDEFMAFMRSWMREKGPLIPITRFNGLEDAPKALKSLFEGRNLGKTLVCLT